MARRSNATWVFLALVFGGVAALAARAMRSPEPAAPGSGAPSASAGAGAGASATGGTAPSTAGSMRSRWFAETDQIAADPTALPLLGGLQLGSTVIPGWQLVGVNGAREGRIEVLLDGRGEVGMVVWIERKKGDKAAPFQTATYSLSYGGAHPIDVLATEQSALAKAIRDRVAKSEATVPIPPGL